MILGGWIESHARIRKLCGVTKRVDERIDEGILRWFSHEEKMEMDRTAKRVYVEDCVRICSVGRPRKGWIGAVKDCLRKRGLDVRQTRKMVQDRNRNRREKGNRKITLKRTSGSK